MRKLIVLLAPFILLSCLFVTASTSYTISITKLAQIDTGGIYDFMIKDNIAYAVDTYHDNPEGLVLINITNPSDPQLLDTFFDGGIYDYVTVVDDYAYLANRETGIEIIDVSDPTNITKIGSYYDGGEAYELRIVGQLVYVADGSQGFVILNVSDPTNPFKVNQRSSFCCSSLTINDNKAYLIDHKSLFSGLLVVDVSDPNNLELLGSHYEDYLDMIFPRVYGNMMLVANHHENTGEVRIYNVSNPADITLISSFKGGGTASKMELVDDVLFLASSAGLEVVNLADIHEPSLIDSFINAGIGYDVVAQGEMLFFSAREEGLGIYEYSLEEIPEKTEGYIFQCIIVGIFAVYVVRRKLLNKITVKK